MAARDRFCRKVECAICGQRGVFNLSEDDHPYMRAPHTELDSVEGPFLAVMLAWEGQSAMHRMWDGV